MTPSETATHTPAPWIAESGETNGNEHGAWGCVSSVPAGLFVASVWANVERLQGEAEANANLIAAAPDLLAALKDTLDYWTTIGFAQCDDDCDCIVEQVRAVIAKAEGR